MGTKTKLTCKGVNPKNEKAVEEPRIHGISKDPLHWDIKSKHLWMKCHPCMF